MRSVPDTPPEHEHLVSIGVTGTNGKTSTTWWINHLLSGFAPPVPMTSTLGSYLGDQRLDLPRTWQGFIETMRAGIESCARFATIEVTSESLAKGFGKAWPCAIGVFTNLSHDHLNAHGSPEHYLASKAQLFVHMTPGNMAILNGCDEVSPLLAEILPMGVELRTFGTAARGEQHMPIDVQITDVRLGWDGTFFVLTAPRYGLAPQPFSVPTIGEVFAENATAAWLAAVCAGMPKDEAHVRLTSAKAPKGRFEVVHKEPYVVVDYAHTPDALERTLRTARTLCKGSLTVVFGAGGERDRDKRAPMGVAACLADRIVLTSDNPRGEDPNAIAKESAKGTGPHGNCRVELDRRTAIELALDHAKHDDVIVIAGRGHELSQRIGDQDVPFDDSEVAKEICEK